MGTSVTQQGTRTSAKKKHTEAMANMDTNVSKPRKQGGSMGLPLASPTGRLPQTTRDDQQQQAATTKTSTSRSVMSAAVAVALLYAVYSLVSLLQSHVALHRAEALLHTFLLVAGLNTIGWAHGSLWRTERGYDLFGTGSFIAATIFTLSRSHAFENEEWGSRVAARQALLSALVIIWALRLGSHLVVRVCRAGSGGDRRFRTIKQNPARFATAWAGQVVWVCLVGAPVWLTNLQASTGQSQPSRTPPLQLPVDALSVGLTLFIGGFLVEWKADAEKAAFKRAQQASDPSVRPKHPWIEQGLWAHSRHPNYAGEILLWTGISVIAVSSLPTSSLAVVGACVASPLLLTFLLTCVSGVPLLAAYAEKNWGSDPAFVAYKARTGVLLPLVFERPLRFVWHLLWAIIAMTTMYLCSRMFPYISHDLRLMPTEINAWPLAITQPLDFDVLAPLGGRDAVPSSLALGVETLWNVLLIAQFGLCHVGFARPALYRLCGSRYHRVLFMIVTCASYHAIMLGWRHHRGLLVWDGVPLLQQGLHVLAGIDVSRELFLDIIIPIWSFIPIILCCSTVFKLDVFYFFGARQMFMTDAEEKKADEEYAEEQRVRQAAIEKNKQQQQQQSQSGSSEPLVLSSSASKSDSKQLMVTGMYRIVRHPMYMWLQLTVLLTPHMPFDRMVYFGATTALLYVGLKFEERKLLREFGEDYAAYMKRTPMLFPSLTALCGCGARNKTNNKDKKTQ